MSHLHSLCQKLSYSESTLKSDSLITVFEAGN